MLLLQITDLNHSKILQIFILRRESEAQFEGYLLHNQF